MANFNSLPLEIKNMVYGHALDPNHDIFTNGVPALLKVHPLITREIYSYRKIITTIRIHICDDDAWPQETEQTHYKMIARFGQKGNTKGMVVVIKRSWRIKGGQSPGELLDAHRESLNAWLYGDRLYMHTLRLRPLIKVETRLEDEVDEAN